MALVKFICPQCGQTAAKQAGSVNRSRALGWPVYCGRECAGLARRKHKTKTQLVEEKRLYDKQYRHKNRERLKAEKAAYYQRTRDPEKERVIRQKNMPRHVEYCRRPEYRAYKQEYDRQRKLQKFGPFAECYLLLQDLNAEIASRMSKYDIRMANGYYAKQAEKQRLRRLANAIPVRR